MWESGPLREWSGADKRPKSHFIPYAKGGYVGAYACERCCGPCDGVYLVREEQRWLCGACKEAFRPKRMQPAHLRRAGEWLACAAAGK